MVKRQYLNMFDFSAKRLGIFEGKPQNLASSFIDFIKRLLGKVRPKPTNPAPQHQDGSRSGCPRRDGLNAE